MVIVLYRPMILQYSEILAYYWFSKVKQQFMTHRQQCFYDPCSASAVTKHMAQWKTTTAGMTMETNTTMPLPDQCPMVWSSIRSRSRGLADEDRAMKSTAHVGAAHYISTLLKICHKPLYAKFCVLDWCRCHVKKSVHSGRHHPGYLWNLPPPKKT